MSGCHPVQSSGLGLVHAEGSGSTGVLSADAGAAEGLRHRVAAAEAAGIENGNRGSETVEEWKERMDRHHELGYRHPFGCFLRYWLRDRRGRKLGSVCCLRRARPGFPVVTPGLAGGIGIGRSVFRGW